MSFDLKIHDIDLDSILYAAYRALESNEPARVEIKASHGVG